LCALISFVGGFFVGLFANWCFAKWQVEARHRELRKKYENLAGAYSIYRGGTTDTSGTVELTQNDDGTFDVVARHSTGEIDWKGRIRMSLDRENLGEGDYTHAAGPPTGPHGVGTQWVRYFPEDPSLHVEGTSKSLPVQVTFFHVWRRISTNPSRPAQ
jgi:hypothetical protein